MPESCLLRSRLFAEHGVLGIFSLRTGGVSQAPFDSMNLADDTGDDAQSVAPAQILGVRQPGRGQ